MTRGGGGEQRAMMDYILIQQTISTYSEAASRADWDEVLATFTPDGVWELPALGQAHRIKP